MTNRKNVKKSEEKMASCLKIKLIDHIADIDLPYFLFYEIHKTLDELNYFKLSNLFLNISNYSTYLTSLADRYNNEMRSMDTRKSSGKKSLSQSRQYYTTTLEKEDVRLALDTSVSTVIHTKYCVSTILTMKEYIHRRMTKASKIKMQRVSTAVSA